MTDTLTHIIREDACKLGDAHGWNTEDSDGNVVYAHKDKFRVTVFYPIGDPWEGAPERVRVSYQLTDDTWNEVELPEPDVRWALTVFGQDPLPPLTEWLLDHGYDPRTDRSLPYNVRMQWHYQTGTEDAESWGTVPESWGAFDSWRSRFNR